MHAGKKNNGGDTDDQQRNNNNHKNRVTQPPPGAVDSGGNPYGAGVPNQNGRHVNHPHVDNGNDDNDGPGKQNRHKDPTVDAQETDKSGKIKGPERPEEGPKVREESKADRKDKSTDHFKKVEKPDGSVDEVSSSGKVRNHIEKRDDGEHISHMSPTGRKQSEEVQQPDGKKRTTNFDIKGRPDKEEVKAADGTREVGNHRYDRNGQERLHETVKYDSQNKIVSKTKIKIVNKTVYKTEYKWGPYGYVYVPAVYVVDPFWYDPFWYGPQDVVVVHPFTYTWTWGGWYHHYGGYWTTYEVYPAPSYWVTDWVVADYYRDHYEAQISADEAREEARLARAEAREARELAEKSEDEAEVAEAKLAQEKAERRAEIAEMKLKKAEQAETSDGKPNANAASLDKDTKEQLRVQIEQTITEKKKLAEQSKNGGTPVPPDVSTALADPKHVYAVSDSISVTTPEAKLAGKLTEGDLLRLEPGQEDTLKDVKDTTLVKMRVLTSKGDDDEVTAGSVVSVSVAQLQQFDSEFRAKLDAGLEEAAKNKETFKEKTVAQAASK